MGQVRYCKDCRQPIDHDGAGLWCRSCGRKALDEANERLRNDPSWPLRMRPCRRCGAHIGHTGKSKICIPCETEVMGEQIKADQRREELAEERWQMKHQENLHRRQTGQLTTQEIVVLAILAGLILIGIAQALAG